MKRLKTTVIIWEELRLCGTNSWTYLVQSMLGQTQSSRMQKTIA